jgi:hypothetical protein
MLTSQNLGVVLMLCIQSCGPVDLEIFTPKILESRLPSTRRYLEWVHHPNEWIVESLFCSGHENQT